MSLRTLFLLAALAGACTGPRPGNIDLDRLLNADREPDQWLALGRTFRGDRFSPLTRINAQNVARLGFAWEYSARSRRGRVEHGQEATPIVVDGVLYISGPWGTVFAVDAKTGSERWRYDPEVDGSYARRACCDVVSRGLQVWRGKVYVATLDGYLVALDAETGREVWKVDTFMDRDTRFYTITGPPQIAKDVVVVGNSGGEFGVRGYITAYDLETGQQRWRFFTVPGDLAKGPPEHPEMEMALKTWDPNSNWESGLGGTVWGEMNYDPDLNLLYVGTGNSSPYPIWYRSPSGGDNLFLVSILAINPDDGRLKWHYQQTPGEIWDYTATANMILADLTIGGRVRKVIMQAPKSGFFFVLDRESGEFISAEPFVFVNWATGYDSIGRPIVNPKAVYRDGPAVVFPSAMGAHNWQPMAFNPENGLAYIPGREEGMVLLSEPQYKWRQGATNMGSGAFLPGIAGALPGAARAAFMGVVKANADLPPIEPREVLIAYDPVAQEERWRVPVGTTDWSGGGVLTTAGNLVIQGTSAGFLTAYRADTGEKLAEIEVGTAIMAAPVTYEIDGEQYVAVIAGFGGAIVASMHPPGSAPYRYQNYGRLLAFKLGGGKVPLPPARQAKATPEPPALPGYSEELAARGEVVWGAAACFFCHGGYGEARLSSYPDLYRMTAETHAAFDSIVLGDSLASSGMASFADVLTPEDAAVIHAYLVREQGKLYRKERGR